jgi:hypothetical protein
MPGSVHIPWYATAFRHDKLADALAEIAPLAVRFGATGWHVYRYRDDRYKFLQVATFEDKTDWERYWGGHDFTRWRSVHNGWYQVPVLYQWADIVTQGSLPAEPAELAATGEGGDAQAG